MKPSNTVWGRVLACCLAASGTLGFWAGSAAAQSGASDGWFDDAAQPAPVPPADDEGSPADDEAPSAPDYSPPPADFQTPPPAASPPASDVAPENDPRAQERAVQEFSPRLEPYGRWVDDPWYGRVWVPSRSVVGAEFVPYSTGGHWELTPDDAWLWASDYPFGSVTFHYGRWVWASRGVWAWVPGYVYAPAWVDFHVGAAGYIGWAPLAPSYVWRNGVYLSVGYYHPAPVVYCPTPYVFARSMPHYVVRDRARVRSISAQTHVYQPRYRARGGVSYVSRGPSPAEARIPARALPSTRVIAQPRLAAYGGTRRTRIESSTYPSRPSYPAQRGFASERSPAHRAYPADRVYPSNPSNRAPAARPHSYDGYRSSVPPRSADHRSTARSPSGGWYDGPSRGNQRGFAAPSGQRAQPNRAPWGVPHQRMGTRPAQYGGFDRGSVAPRASRPEAEQRHGQRRDGGGSSSDSRVRARAAPRYGVR